LPELIQRAFCRQFITSHFGNLTNFGDYSPEVSMFGNIEFPRNIVKAAINENPAFVFDIKIFKQAVFRAVVLASADARNQRKSHQDGNY